MPTLDIYRGGKLLRQQVLVDTEILIVGRATSCDVVLSDRERRVSRSHSALVRSQRPSADFFVRDLGSLYGTRVNGMPVDQKLLNDDDSIEIADYKLVYSSRHSIDAEFRHLRLIPARRLSGRGTSSGSTTKTAHLSKRVVLDPTKQELLDEMQRQMRGSAALSELASDIVVAILRAVGAEKGFIGLLTDDGSKVHSEFGVVNFRAEETIDISEPDFTDALARGEVFQEGNVVLVPIGRSPKLTAFLCIMSGRTRPPLNSEDVAFLLALGRLLPTNPYHEPAKKKGRPPADQISPWPKGIIGKSQRIRSLLAEIHDAAGSDLNVMILGETGTGKELVAQAIHERSANSQGPFVARNCSQVTETLAESEIFGYAPQSGISGANPKGAAGWLELANGGTLFLDEVHSLGPALQDKFLRFLQDKEVWRIGATSPVHASVKVVAATDEDLEQGVKSGRFRPPFLYRFGMTIHVPPLRSRPDDIPLLAFYFVDKYASATGSRTRSISHRALRLLVESDWPGNVRQLEHQVQLAVARGREVLFSWDFATSAASAPGPRDRSPKSGIRPEGPVRTADHPMTMDQVEKDHIKEVLETTKGNLSESAKLLGKSRQTLLNKMDRYHIPRNYSARMKDDGDFR
jgi:two-component system response regulator HydG